MSETESPSRTPAYWVAAWLPVAVWAVVIFLLSRDPHSGRHIHEILRWAFGLAGIHHVTDMRTWALVAAKGAHFTVYFVLSLLVYRAFALGRGAGFLGKQAGWTLLVIFLYAASDEFHQTLIHGRNGSWRDVVLDTFGGAVALILLRAILAVRTRRGKEARPEHVSA